MQYYFTQQTQDAIIEYNSLHPVFDYQKRSRLFQLKINQPFNKLCQNIIHTYKLYYFQQPSDIIKLQTVSFLVLQLHKYNPQKGKAFSYFTKIAYYYLINANNKNYNDYKIVESLQQFDQPYKNALLNYIFSQHNVYKCDYQNIVVNSIELIQQNIDYLFNKQRDKNIAKSIIQLMKR